MTDTTHLEAKVLLLDQDPQQCRALTEFCRSAGLQSLLGTSHDVGGTLDLHKDLAGVLLAEDIPCAGPDGLSLAAAIHKMRSEPAIAGADCDQPRAQVHLLWLTRPATLRPLQPK